MGSEDADTAARAAAPMRPDRRTLFVVGLTAAAAIVIDAAALLWGVATVLSTSCGEDLAWLGLLGAPGVVTLSASVGVLGLVHWWRRQHPLLFQAWITRGMMTATTVAFAVAIVAVLWLPDGSCP